MTTSTNTKTPAPEKPGVVAEQKIFYGLDKLFAKAHARRAEERGQGPNGAVDLENPHWVQDLWVSRAFDAHEGDTVVDRLQSIPTTDLRVAQAASGLRSCMKVVIGTNGNYFFYRWNGMFYESGNDSTEFWKVVTAIVEALGVTLRRLTADIDDWIDTLNLEYQTASYGLSPVQKGDLKSTIYPVEFDRIKEIKKYGERRAKDYENSAARRGLAEHLLHELAVDAETFDSNRYLVFDNGVLDIQESLEQMKPVFSEGHSSERPVLKRHRVHCEYIDYGDRLDIGDLNSIDAPNLELYLRSNYEVDEESGLRISHRDDMLNLFRAEAVGLLSGRSIRCTPMLHGASGSGKGMFLRWAEALYSEGEGEDADGHFTTGGRSVFTTGGKDSDKYAGGDIIDHRLIFNDEMAANDDALDQEALKEWSGGSPVRILRKFRGSTTTKFRGVIFTILNTPTSFNPIVKLKDDPGMSTRYFPVYFPYSYSSTAEEAVRQTPENPNLEWDVMEEFPQMIWLKLQLWLAWEASEHTDTIPLTEHQKGLRALTEHRGDKFAAVLSTGSDEKVWEQVSEDEKIPLNKRVTLTEYYAHHSRIVKSLYREEVTKPHVQAVLEAGDRLYSGKGNRLFVKGLRLGGDWARAIAPVNEEITRGM